MGLDYNGTTYLSITIYIISYNTLNRMDSFYADQEKPHLCLLCADWLSRLKIWYFHTQKGRFTLSYQPPPTVKRLLV